MARIIATAFMILLLGMGSLGAVYASSCTKGSAIHSDRAGSFCRPTKASNFNKQGKPHVLCCSVFCYRSCQCCG
jgi:hypothetical protein